MTGYTHNMVEKNLTFPQFALSCARAFGALIEMRDDDMNAPIPEAMKPDDYHARAAKEAEDKLTRLSAMTGGERLAYGRKIIADNVAHMREALARDEAQDAKLRDMLVKVAGWKPPTSEHEGLKRFMVEQLTGSLSSGDYYREALATWAEKDPASILDEEMARARDDIKYHAKKQAEENQRTAERNKWLVDLRASLK